MLHDYLVTDNEYTSRYSLIVDLTELHPGPINFGHCTQFQQQQLAPRWFAASCLKIKSIYISDRQVLSNILLGQPLGPTYLGHCLIPVDDRTFIDDLEPLLSYELFIWSFGRGMK